MTSIYVFLCFFTSYFCLYFYFIFSNLTSMDHIMSHILGVDSFGWGHNVDQDLTSNHIAEMKMHVYVNRIIVKKCTWKKLRYGMLVMRSLTHMMGSVFFWEMSLAKVHYMGMIGHG